MTGLLLFHSHDEPGSPAGSRASSTRTARRRRACRVVRTRSTRRGRLDRAAAVAIGPSSTIAFDPQPSRSGSAATSTASTGHGSLKLPARLDRQPREERPRGRGARRRSLARKRARRAATGSRSASPTPRNPARSSRERTASPSADALVLAACARRLRRGLQAAARPDETSPSSSAPSTTPSATRARRSSSSTTAGFDAVGITASGSPASRRRGDELAVLAGRRRARRRDADLPRRLPLRLVDDAADARGADQFAAYVTAILRDAPGDPRRHRRQRAEPEPLLAAAVRRSGERVAAPAYLALLIEVYDAVKQAAPNVTVWGGALAPRGIDRPGPAATRTRRRPSSATSAPLPRQRAAQPPLDGFAFHPYPASSSSPPDRPTDPESNSILMADYERSCGRCSTRRSGPTSRSSTASSASRRRSRRQGGALRGRGAGRAGRRGDAGRLLPPRDRARRLPGGGRGGPPLPLARRAGADRLPVGRVLRRRDAEGEPRARARLDPERRLLERTMRP